MSSGRFANRPYQGDACPRIIPTFSNAKDRGLNRTATCTGGFHTLITRRIKVSVNPPLLNSRTDLILIPNEVSLNRFIFHQLQLVNIPKRAAEGRVFNVF
jgi:hypothetical protein